MDDQTISVGLVFFIIAVIGFLSGMWWRIEGAIGKAKSEAVTRAEAASALATLAGQQLAEHKLHVAETYVSKQGMRETRDEIMGGIKDTLAQVSALNQRMDRVIEGSRHNPPPKPNRQA